MYLSMPVILVLAFLFIPGFAALVFTLLAICIQGLFYILVSPLLLLAWIVEQFENKEVKP